MVAEDTVRHSEVGRIFSQINETVTGRFIKETCIKSDFVICTAVSGRVTVVDPEVRGSISLDAVMIRFTISRVGYQG